MDIVAMKAYVLGYKPFLASFLTDPLSTKRFCSFMLRSVKGEFAAVWCKVLSLLKRVKRFVVYTKAGCDDNSGNETQPKWEYAERERERERERRCCFAELVTDLHSFFEDTFTPINEAQHKYVCFDIFDTLKKNL